MKNWTSPIRILVVFLALLTIAASVSWAGTQTSMWLQLVLNLVLLLGSSWGTFMVLEKFGLAKATRWEHRVITALILFLLFDSSLAWYVFVFLGVISEATQRLIRLPTGPVFNPAAVTAALATLLGWYPGWWGVSFAPRLMIFGPGLSIATFVTVPVATYVAWKYKKLPIMGIAAVSFGVLYGLFARINPAFMLLEGTLAFFLLVMAVEPKTSPVLLKEQLIFGGALGGLMAIAIFLAWPEPNCMPLLICNLVFNLYRNRKWVVKKFQPTPPVAAPVTPVS
jgi:hypothetical protein